jgi:uncharacterized protein Yka (UPF0111/DUF47 family)
MITNITLETVDKVWDSVETILRIVNRNDQIKPIGDTIIKMKEDNIPYINQVNSIINNLHDVINGWK